MSIQSIIELHSNPDFLVDTSIILCHQKFSWFQTKDTKFHAIKSPPLKYSETPQSDMWTLVSDSLLCMF